MEDTVGNDQHASQRPTPAVANNVNLNGKIGLQGKPPARVLPDPLPEEVSLLLTFYFLVVKFITAVIRRTGFIVSSSITVFANARCSLGCLVCTTTPDEVSI